MKIETTNERKLTRLVVGIFLGFALCTIAFPVYNFVTSFFYGTEIQRLRSGIGHSALLYKKGIIVDINFVVTVDGKQVYVSPDYAAFQDRLYRETLVWDKTGQIVVLELMGKRVFAYNARERRELQKGELSKYKFYPMPSDTNYAPIKDIEENESLQ